MAKKVVVAMSGGIDSSVAAYLLKQQGYDVSGITLWLTGDAPSKDAQIVAEILGIPHRVLDFRGQFKKSVMDYFINAYLSGQTPNPCVVCNSKIKFGALLEYALDGGADYLATGHYAHVIIQDAYATLRRAGNKDQTYALYRLTQHQLRHTMMPLANYQKEEIRAIAKSAQLPIYNKPDSQEICFVEDNKYINFIEMHSKKPQESGNFIDKQGKILGRHLGLCRYTIGQRKGIGISLGKPAYVCALDIADNAVILGDDQDLWSKEMSVKNVTAMKFTNISQEIKCYGKIRYAHKAAPCIIRFINNRIICHFDDTQRAITPGQSAVFYDDEGEILLGGIITNSAI